jgi:S1-C subfamily serine protease
MHRPSLVFIAVALAAGGCSFGGNDERKADSATTNRPPASLADLVTQTRSGVVRIETRSCQGTRFGTGFLLDPRTVITVEHVVDGARHITLKRSGQVVADADLIGADRDRDLALLRADSPVQGFYFELAEQTPRVGDGVAALGFPLGLPLSVTRGSVSGVERMLSIDGSPRRHLVQTDAAVNQGSSGGPLLDLGSGEVVGLIDLATTEANGIAFAVSSDTAGRLLDAWREAPAGVKNIGCNKRRAVTPAPIPDKVLGSRGEPGVTSYYGKYFAIDYPASWKVKLAEKRRGRHVGTVIRATGHRSVLLQVDFLRNENQEPMVSAQRARASMSGQPSYRELEFSRAILVGDAAVRWEFLIEENGVAIHKVAVFGLTAAGDGVTILTQAPESEYYNWSRVFDGIRNSYVEFTR